MMIGRRKPSTSVLEHIFDSILRLQSEIPVTLAKRNCIYINLNLICKCCHNGVTPFHAVYSFILRSIHFLEACILQHMTTKS